MALAHLMNIDRNAVICDFAETYQVFNMWALPARQAATLACGLGPNSRIMQKVAGVELSPPFSLLVAMLIDEVRALRYMFADESAGEPAFITDAIMGGQKPNGKNTDGNLMAFESGAEFDEMRAKIAERITKQNGG